MRLKEYTTLSGKWARCSLSFVIEPSDESQ